MIFYYREKNLNNKRKKILFVIINMKIGGTRSSLINLLNFLQYENLDVDLLLLSPIGPYKNKINHNVNIRKTPFISKCIFSEFDELNTLEKFIKILMIIIRKILGDNKGFYLIYKLIARNISKNIKYDVSIGFQEGESNDCASFMSAKKHYLWIHNNYEYFKGNSKGLLYSYEIADKIIFVANASMNSFCEKFPIYEKKLILIKNIIQNDFILKNANKSILDNYLFKEDMINIISVGRLSNQKRFDRAIEVANRLKNDGLRFNWLIMGEGAEKSFLQGKISEYDLNHYVKLIGSKTNPYPYMKKSDLFVMTSFYESQPMAILEALIIGIPVVTTDFDSAHEIIKNDELGLIVKNSVNGLYYGVKDLIINNKFLYLKDKEKKFIYDNEQIIEKFMKLVVSNEVE